MSAGHSGTSVAVSPDDVYGRPVLVLSVTSVLLAVILITVSLVIPFDPVWRSVSVGSGLVILSTGLTVFVAAFMYRMAPAATAPALALLYLLKVVAMGWFLLSVGAPDWLHARGFAITVAVALMLSWLVLAPLAARASSALATEYARRVREKQEESSMQDETSAATTLDETAPATTEGGEHGQVRP